MNTVLDPSILFISNEDWKIEEVRDEFLEHCYDILGKIDEKNIKIYWSENLDYYLLESPQIPPWRFEKDWGNQITPILYRLLNSNIESLEFKKEWDVCKVNPSLKHSYNKEEIHNCFLKLMHEIIDRNEQIYLCLSKDNIEEQYSFKCDCHPNELKPSIVRNNSEWIKYINVEEEYWPINKDDFLKFEQALEIVRLLKYPKKSFRYKYKFSNTFKKSILKEDLHKSDILEKIAKRLTLTKQEAYKDSVLQDELLQGKTKIYRFRVTPRPASTRIHYKFDGNNAIEFLEYYGQGHHDDGL